jgi:hypothetical protein
MRTLCCLALAGAVIAPAHSERVVQGPLVAFSWSKVPADCHWITPMVWVSKTSDPVALVAESLTQPPGRAAIFIWDLERDLLSDPQDVCRTLDGQPTEFLGVWPEHGTQVARERVETFFTAFQKAGGRCDYLILDYEGGYSNWHMTQKRAERLAAIAADPRSADLRREMGTDDLAKIADLSTKLYLKWNALTGTIKDRALDEAVFGPVRRLYPAAKCSNYGSFIMSPQNIVPETNGHLAWSDSFCGTHQSRSFYGTIGQLQGRVLAGDRPYGNAPFDVLRYHLNTLRAILRSSDAPFQPWISHKAFVEGQFRDNDYYQELLYHLALSGVTDVLYWNPGTWRKDQDPAGWRTDEQDRLVNQCLADLNARFGDAPRTCVTLQPMAWDSTLIATGMKVGARYLWRVTVPPGIPAVRVKGEARTLDGSLGLWVETETMDLPMETIPPGGA